MPKKIASVIVATALLSIAGIANAQDAKPRIADIDWTEAGVIPVSGNAKERLQDVDATLLPVLVPKAFFDFKSLRFVGQPLEYAASVRATGAAMSVVGTRIAIDVEGDTVAAGPAAEIEIGEKSISASIKQYGAAYVITIECENAADPRCAKDSYVQDLLAGLELVGGGKGQPTTKPATTPASSLIGVSADPAFLYDPPGKLHGGGGAGASSTIIYAPNIRFPVEEKPAYLNSQVYGVGGYLGKYSPKSWKDRENYKYPWFDNFCEKRSRRTPSCPGGTGHQGVDIRPALPSDRKYMAVAVEPGRIVKVGVYSVTLAGNSGNHYNYLHLEMAQLKVRRGDTVAEGQPIGLISNDFGKVPTSVHLHFEIMQNVNGMGWRHVPPYSSLVAAYKAM